MKTTMLAVIGCTVLTTMALANITWDITNSTYNGAPFVGAEGAPGMGQAGSGATAAYGGGSMDGDIFHMGFQANGPSDPTQNDDLHGTALDAGTSVTLAFTKDASDHINYIAMNADPLSGVSLLDSSPTNFAVSFKVVNPVLSQSGDLGAAFGMGISISVNSLVDYGGSVFVADLCPGDVTDPVNPVSGAMTINAQGSNGVTATFVMYASSNWMTRVGMTSPALAAGYFSDPDGNRTALPESFAMATKGYYNLALGVFTNTASSDSYCFELQNSVWSSHDLGIVTIPQSSSITITKIQAKANFAKPNTDSFSLTSVLGPGVSFNPTNALVMIDIGGADVSFTLDPKGKGIGTSPQGPCKLSYNKKLGSWTLKANLKNGSWQTPWADAGMTKTTTDKLGQPITLSVVVSINGEIAFTKNCSLNYRAVVNKSGTAR